MTVRQPAILREQAFRWLWRDARRGRDSLAALMGAGMLLINNDGRGRGIGPGRNCTQRVCDPTGVVAAPMPAAPETLGKSQCGRRRKISEKSTGDDGDPTDFFTGSQIIIASNSTAAIPTIKQASAAASYSSQYLCTRMKSILHRGMGEHQLSMDN
jgi:hypothetical protein